MLSDVTARPIGYWLKHLHNLIEDHFASALADAGVTRRDWQILNVLSRQPQTPAQLDRALAPFLRDETSAHAGVAEARDGLVAMGWVGADPVTGLLSLTGAGRTAHADLSARVGEIRELLMRDMTRDQYTATVDVLATMAANIEAARTST